MDVNRESIEAAKLMTGFGREYPLTRARADLGPSELFNARWKRIILGKYLSRLKLPTHVQMRDMLQALCRLMR